MKVVLFCGGLGMRIREFSENIPKPMVPIGYRPILWHVMRYYAHFGHKDFILCLGYRGDAVKDYFLKYDECISNDFVLSEGGSRIDLLRSDIADWRITFVDTGTQANVGQRLKAVQRHLEGEEIFLANYSDGLTDLPLPEQISHLERSGKTATFVSVRPNLSYHFVRHEGDGTVTHMADVTGEDLRINGGYFVLRKEIFDYLHEGEELVVEPFHRLVAERRLAAYRHDGFWMSMDTFKDRQRLEELYQSGHAPWALWESGRNDS